MLVKQLRRGIETVADVEILSPNHAQLSSSMLSFRSPRIGYRELFSVLVQDHGLRCRPVSERGLDAVRVSCHMFNTAEDIDLLIAAIKTTVSTA